MKTPDVTDSPKAPLPVGCDHLLGMVKQRFFTMTLGDCPPGLFLFNGHFGFKTEYTDQNGPEAYVVESGEYFWGGADGDKCKRANLVVMPVIIDKSRKLLNEPSC